MERPVPYVHPLEVRYLEADRQGVVFNMWYLAYADDALAGFLAAGGLPYRELVAGGHDLQLVHTELDWSGPLTWGVPAAVTVTPVRLGRTSFVLDFGFSADGTPVATATTVYVVVATDGTGARPVPDRLLAALGPVPPPAPGLTPPA